MIFVLYVLRLATSSHVTSHARTCVPVDGDGVLSCLQKNDRGAPNRQYVPVIYAPHPPSHTRTQTQTHNLHFHRHQFSLTPKSSSLEDFLFWTVVTSWNHHFISRSTPWQSSAHFIIWTKTQLRLENYVGLMGWCWVLWVIEILGWVRVGRGSQAAKGDTLLFWG